MKCKDGVRNRPREKDPDLRDTYTEMRTSWIISGFTFIWWFLATPPKKMSSPLGITLPIWDKLVAPKGPQGPPRALPEALSRGSPEARSPIFAISSRITWFAGHLDAILGADSLPMGRNTWCGICRCQMSQIWSVYWNVCSVFHQIKAAFWYAPYKSIHPAVKL